MYQYFYLAIRCVQKYQGIAPNIVCRILNLALIYRNTNFDVKKGWTNPSVICSKKNETPNLALR